MPTEAKKELVAELAEKFGRATSLVLADYRGLTAVEMVALRAKFTKQGLDYCVVKDTLARIAAKEAGLEELADLFTGPIGVAIGYDDPALAFKLTEECRRKYAPRYMPKGGVFEKAVVPEKDVQRYATLPSREELLAKLAFVLAGPVRSLAFVLQAKIRELATSLDEVRKAKERQN